MYWRTVPAPSVQDDIVGGWETVQILHESFRIGNEFSRDFQKNISPTLWVFRSTIRFSTKMSPLPGVPNLYKQPSFRRKPFSPGSFPWRKDGKNAVDLCDGIGLGMLSKGHPIKRDVLLEDIPDNKAFFSCAGARAKSHLKWAEAFTDSSCFWYP
ncbi:hypothetical protein [Sphingobacterium sp.]|uniref:hypothetical protein n=1 Tax=Sphingobacterium sp. TaxID=341027 RepID=UPI0028AF9021|nr:hypothetical protein [Sphingobacterium sp.]